MLCKLMLHFLEEPLGKPTPLSHQFGFDTVDKRYIMLAVRTACFLVYVVAVHSIEGTTDLALTTAQSYVEEGDIAFGSGDHKNSLAFYRAAVRLYPSSSDFWIKLGTVEYGLNELVKSKSRFDKVLQLDSNSATAKYYLKQIEGKQKKANVCFDDNCDSDDDDDTEDGEVLPIPEYSHDLWLQNPDGSYYINGFEELSKHPFIIRQSLPFMNWNMAHFTLDNLQSVSGSVTVDFYPQNMLTRPEKTYKVPLTEAIDFLRFPEGAYLTVDTSEPGSYVQWNINSSFWKDIHQQGNVKLDSYYVSNLQMFFKELAGPESSDDTATQTLVTELSEYFEVITHWNMLLIGEKGSGMFDHQDALPVGSWQAQISGSKRFKICAPVDDTSITSEAAVETDGAASMDSSSGDVDEKGPCMEGTSSAGDFLYYPPHYHHQTLNTEGPSIALSGTLILGRDKAEFRDLLVRECGPLKEKNYQLSKEFCQFILQHRS